MTTTTWSVNREPRSFTQIHQYLEESLLQCSSMIDNAELDYFQGSSKETFNSMNINRSLAVVTLNAWSQPLNELREARLLRDIRNGKAIREMLGEAKIGLLFGPYTEESLVLINRIMDKTNEQLYSKIPTISNKIEEIMNLMERYLLSFFDIHKIEDIIENKKKEVPPDEYLETVYNYEKSRWLHMFDVNKCLKRLGEMKTRVEDSKGVILSSLSKDIQDLALRCDCTCLSYIFALPECYHTARQALNELQIWLRDDRDYNDFVQNSLKIIEEKYLEAKKSFESSKRELSNLEHRTESFRLQVRKAEEENKLNEQKLEDFETKQNVKEREYISRRLTHEVHVEQLNKLIAASESSNGSIDNRLSIERFEKDIKELTRDVAKLKSQLETIQGRIHHLEQRRNDFVKLREDMRQMDKTVQEALEDKIIKENHFNRMQRCYDIIRNIFRCRTTDDLAQKIFYDLPVMNRHISDDEEDSLSKACRLISKSIGRDWNRLYWHLPFYPVRGQEEIAKDIQHIDEKYQRGDVCEDQAVDALDKWRRYHTRATTKDLIEALRKLRRLDLVQLLRKNVFKPKHLLNLETVHVDPRKKEIDELNKKLNRLYEKIRISSMNSQESYATPTKGLTQAKSLRKSTEFFLNPDQQVQPIASSSLSVSLDM